MFGDVANNKSNTFSDVSKTHWAKAFIDGAVSMNWINGYADGTFKPDNQITRAEVVAIVNRATERRADKEYINSNKTKLAQYTDLKDTAYWAYYDIVEASNTHTAVISSDSEAWTVVHK